MFSRELKLLRKQSGFSQAALAERLGISQQAVGKWENGKSTPDPAALSELADIFGVSMDRLLGREISEASNRRNFGPQEVMLPVVGTVKAGYGAYAFEDDYGMEPANVRNPQDYFYLIVRGDSMEPRIRSGDLALVHRQTQIESGELAVVLIDGDEGTLKRVIKKDGAVILQPFNQAYQTQIFVGAEAQRLSIVGKVVETKAKW